MSRSRASVAGVTPRRSTRLQTASQSAGPSNAGGDPTPSAAGGSRKTPLPKAKSRESRAYGANARLGEAGELGVPDTGFAQGLDAQRDQAIARDEADELEGAQDGPVEDVLGDLAAPSPRLNERSAATYSRYSHHSEMDVTPSAVSSSFMDTSKSFGLERESGMHRGIYGGANGFRETARSSIERPQLPIFATSAAATGRYPDRAPRPMPPLFDGASHTSGRQLGHTPVLRRGQQFDHQGGPPANAQTAAHHPSGLDHAYAPGEHMQSGANGGPSNFAQFSSNVRSVTSWKPFLKGFLYTIGLIGLLMLLWQKAGTVNRDMKPSLEALKKILPEKIHVIRHPDNSIEIPDEFWRALEVKMREEGLSGPGGSGVFEWNEFLTKNNYKILRQMRGDIRASVNSLVHEIVDLPFFVDLVEKEYSKLSALVDKKVEEKVKEKLKAASKSIAKEAAKSAVLDHVRIESLALANLIANSEISLRKVNYFSLRLGTRINTYETSSTLDMHNRALSTFTWLYRKLIAGHHNGPATALQKWDELGECWCASPDDNGHGLAQLSVSLGVPVIPTQVTIDHLPKEASLEIGSAPKRIEIWAESDEADAAAPDCGEGEEGWVCLGTVSYNVHGGNYIQTFNLDARLQKPVHKTIVRVKENWGAPHTCLYRVRLHGIRSPGEKA